MNSDLHVIVPANTMSPVVPLLHYVGRSIFSIAPERLAELKAACRGLRLSIIDEASFRCSYDAPAQTIKLSTGTVELCWAASHAYVTLYDNVLAGTVLTKPKIVDL